MIPEDKAHGAEPSSQWREERVMLNGFKKGLGTSLERWSG